jgi:YidC/Oxa1 family membrane protein insertase
MKLPRMPFKRHDGGARAFSEQDPEFRDLVFYSEGAGDWPHLGPVITALVEHHDTKVSFLTSDPEDPGLRLDDDRIRSFMIGSGTERTVLFRKIDCRNFVMTIPDLQQLWLKRSVHPVHYAYVFHSTNSTHTVYRKAAFDAYDTIYCVGPHHVNEIRRTESHYRLPPKELVPAGSVKLDAVAREFDGHGSGQRDGRPVVLLAPSWGTGSFVEMSLGEPVIRALLNGGFSVVLRLHPMTLRHHANIISSLESTFSNAPDFHVERNMSTTESWLRADVMVSDWSGAATEFAFALGRPVVFLDTPQKIRNPEWQTIGLPAFEDFIRRDVGIVVAVENLQSLAAIVRRAVTSADERAVEIRAARDRWIFNEGRAAETIGAHLASSAPT